MPEGITNLRQNADFAKKSSLTQDLSWLMIYCCVRFFPAIKKILSIREKSTGKRLEDKENKLSLIALALRLKEFLHQPGAFLSQDTACQDRFGMERPVACCRRLYNR